MQTQAATVFVVDDDEGVRNSLRFLLKSVGLATRTLASAGEFLETYQPTQAGCLVLDVRMPGPCSRARLTSCKSRSAIRI